MVPHLSFTRKAVDSSGIDWKLSTIVFCISKLSFLGSLLPMGCEQGLKASK